MEGYSLNKFRTILLGMKSDLTRTLTRSAANECPRGDDADVTQNQIASRLSQELNMRSVAQAKRIDAALRRIKAHSFGTCTECEEPIEEKRLELHPVTTLCAACKEDEERRQMSFHHGHRGTPRRSA